MCQVPHQKLSTDLRVGSEEKNQSKEQSHEEEARYIQIAKSCFKPKNITPIDGVTS